LRQRCASAFRLMCLIIFSSLFFLYSSVPHRDLHSFPTRRSSDLSRRNTPNSPNSTRSVRCDKACDHLIVIRRIPRMWWMAGARNDHGGVVLKATRELVTDQLKQTGAALPANQQYRCGYPSQLGARDGRQVVDTLGQHFPPHLE